MGKRSDELDRVRAGARFPLLKRLAKTSSDEAEIVVPERERPARPSGARFPGKKQLARYEEPEVVVSERESRARSSGARFPGEKQLARDRDPEPEVAAEPEAPEPAAEAIEEPEVIEEPRWPTEPEPVPVYRPPAATPPEVEEVSGPRVRPYVLTRGRTHSSYELQLETLVSVRSDAVWEGAARGAEYQPVLALCAQPRSVAEVAAMLSLPIGVARVLLSDLADLGVMHIHGTERTAEGRPPVALMRRVLDGLQKL